MTIASPANRLLSSSELSPSEVAYLAEGAPRAIGATLVGLAHIGLIEFRDDGRVVPSKPPAAALKDPIERSVVHLVTHADGPASVEDIRQYAEPATEPIRDRLRALGLLLSEEALWIRGLAIAGGCLAAFIGILVVISMSGGDGAKTAGPISFVALPLTAYLVFRRRRTHDGEEVLNRLYEENLALKETAQYAPSLLTPTELARAVATYGADILRGGPLDSAGKALKRERGSCGACGGCGGCGDGCG